MKNFKLDFKMNDINSFLFLNIKSIIILLILSISFIYFIYVSIGHCRRKAADNYLKHTHNSNITEYLDNIIDDSQCNIKINYIINPSNYQILKKVDYYNKFITTEILLKNINVDSRILELYKNITKKINKRIVYGIKKKDNVYRLELYIYKNILTFNNNNTNEKDENDNDFLNYVLLLLSLINEQSHNKDMNIDNIKTKLKLLMLNYNISIFSFDINLDNSFYNNKIHLYTHSYQDNIMQFNTYDYDFINDILILESDYFPINSYDELYNFLNNNQSQFKINFQEINTINKKCNINDIINELKYIAPNCKSIIYHHKYYNNSFGIYLINNDYNCLKKFIKKYDYKESDDSVLWTRDYENLFTNLNFDFGINYSYVDCKINGTGFFDFF
jgi:hypothetical protein